MTSILGTQSTITNKIKHNSGYLKVNAEADIYYEISGNTKGKPLVMLHGGLGSIADLTPYQQCLASKYLIVSVDFRGHGKSTLGNTCLSYSLYQNDIEAVITHLNIDQYFIFGFSDGGIVGYRLAAQHPNKVLALATLGSQWRLTKDDPSIKILNSLTAEFWTEKFKEDVALYHSSNPQPDFPRLIEAVKNVWLDMTTNGYPDHAIKTIDCPTLIIRGDNDFLFSLDEAIALKTILKQANFANIPFSAHAVHHESPDVLISILKQFFYQQNKL